MVGWCRWSTLRWSTKTCGPRVVAGDDASDAGWYDLQTLAEGEGPDLAFDHQAIVTMVLERIRGKVDWAPEVAAALVPSHFTRSELRRVYEVIKGQPLDRSNFAKRFKRMLDEGVFEVVEGSTRELPGAGRPPQPLPVRQLSSARP